MILDFLTISMMHMQKIRSNSIKINVSIHSVQTVKYIPYVYFKLPHCKIQQHETNNIKIDMIMWADL